MNSLSDAHRSEVESGERFEFGANWSRFLKHLNDDRIRLAEASLKDMLGYDRLDGKEFLDIGSGSGLFSLAARRLGAKVYSFDYDPKSVACTTELKRRYFPQDTQWTVHPGSVLDQDYLARLGTWDVVYSWGVLHHTGQMWNALNNVKSLVKPQGLLYIAIYNDKGDETDQWFEVKKRYNTLPSGLAIAYALGVIAKGEWKSLSGHLKNGGLMEWVRSWSDYDKQSVRGMSKWHDEIDWIGGFPYERATIEAIVDWYGDDGFRLLKLQDRSSGYGCNEFVFRREGELGQHILNQIPGGNSLVRQSGYQITSVTKDGEDYRGSLPGPLARMSPEEVLLFREDTLIGLANLQPDGTVSLGQIGLKSGTVPKFYGVRGRLIAPESDFQRGAGHTFVWDLPSLEHAANTQSEPRRSKLFVFQDDKQLPIPHAFHDEIAKIGQGRFSHWSQKVYFATRENTDPKNHRMVIVEVLDDEATSKSIDSNRVV